MNTALLVLTVSCFTMLVIVVDISFAEVLPSSTVEPMITFDKIVYIWTDNVHITILAPEYNLDNNKIDEIGNTIQNPINISTGNHTLDQYRLTETGPDTGVFTGKVTLTGFGYDADGDKKTGDENGYDTCPYTGDNTGIRSEIIDRWGSYQCSYTNNGTGITVGLGPTNGFLENTNDDIITVSFKFSEDDTVSKSALIKWNVGKAQWLGPIHFGDLGTIRIIDPDMNLNSEFRDEFDVDAWSTRDGGGHDPLVRETGNATGIFEGVVSFGYQKHPGTRIVATDGDTVTVRYKDNTLPPPYDTSDDLYVEETHIVTKEPLKRASITNFRIINGIEYFADVIDYLLVSGKPVNLMADIKATQDYLNE